MRPKCLTNWSILLCFGFITPHFLGNSLLKANKLPESIEAYKNSLKLDPDRKEAKYNLSYAQDLLKKQKEQQKQQQQDKNKEDQNKDKNKQDQKKDHALSHRLVGGDKV